MGLLQSRGSRAGRYQRLSAGIHDRAVELVSREPPGRALDVGAGDGTLTRRLLAAGHDVCALDRVIDEKLAATGRARAADLNQPLPFPDESFDIAVCLEVIEHLENPWFLVRELHRVVRPGGAVVISTPNLDSIFVRGYFLMTGRLYNFLDAAYEDIGHITPVYLWNLRRMIERLFALEAVTYNFDMLPKLGTTLPGRTRLLGQCVVVRLRRLPGDTPQLGRRWDDAHVVHRDQ